MDKVKIQKKLIKNGKCCLSIISQELLDLIKKQENNLDKKMASKEKYGISNLLLNELLENDIAEITNCIRMSPTMFHTLLNNISSNKTKIRYYSEKS